MASTLKKLDLDEVRDIIGRALLDGEFRQKLIDDPAGVFLILGYEQSDESLAFFTHLVSNAFRDAAQEVEDRLGGRPIIAVWL